MRSKRELRAFRQHIERAALSFWAIGRNARRPLETRLSVRHARVDGDVARLLRDVVERAIDRIDEIQPYAYVTADQDDITFYHPIAGTEFELITHMLSEDQGTSTAQPADLDKATAYVIRLEHDGSTIDVLRRVPRGFSAKDRPTMWFTDRRLRLAEGPTYRLDENADVVAVGDVIFILDKAAFEQALGFREGLSQTGREILERLDAAALFAPGGAEALWNAVDGKVRKLRRLSAIGGDDLCLRAGFLQRLREINRAEGWGLNFHGDKIRVDADCVDDVLTVLNNDRLKSLLDEHTYDVHVKRPARVAERREASGQTMRSTRESERRATAKRSSARKSSSGSSPKSERRRS
jgi:hypothetical protein